MFNRKEYMKQYRIDNKEKLLEYERQYYIDNLEKISKRQKQYYLKNQTEISSKEKSYREKNKEKIRKRHKEWCNNNREKIREASRNYYIKNKDERMAYRIKNREKRRKYESEMRKSSSKYNLSHKISRGIKYSLKESKAGRHWETLVGYTVNDLKRHLKRTVPKEYTWQDFLNGKLHIDHIVPISAHNFTKTNHIDFKRCWALSNLQLLPAKENISKHNKLNKPFQPALKI